MEELLLLPIPSAVRLRRLPRRHPIRSVAVEEAWRELRLRPPHPIRLAVRPLSLKIPRLPRPPPIHSNNPALRPEAPRKIPN